MLVLELSAGGELFDYLMHTGPFDDVLARTYFRSMIAALELCHSQGIFHRDIKPENLLVSSDYTLKLADFGLASVNTDVNTLCSTECGTRSYMSPEVMKRVPYDGSKADIWSAGVVLFILISGFPPFQVAGGNDWWYRACAAGRHDKFWMAHLRTCPKFPPQAQELLNGIFTVDPSKRVSIDEIWEYPWMQGPVLSEQELQQIMNRRTTVTMAEKEKELRAAAAAKAQASGQTFDPYAANTYRSIQSESPSKEGAGTKEEGAGEKSNLLSPPSLASSSFLVNSNMIGQAFEALSSHFTTLGATSVKLNGQILKASFPHRTIATCSSPVEGGVQGEDFDNEEDMPALPPSLSLLDAEGVLHVEVSCVEVLADDRTPLGHRMDVKKIGGSQALFTDFVSTNVAPIISTTSQYALTTDSKQEAVIENDASEDVF
jgi:serine/threonine protein kinase